jgi:5-formyltetrahydrofolate cyclo-ligase
MTGSTRVVKAQLRQEMARVRAAVPAAEAEAAGREVAARLAAWEPFRAAARVALYAAVGGELPTRACFEAVVASGRPALLPKIGAVRQLAFVALTRWEDLRPGRHGIPEAPGTAEDAPAAGDLVLVPGLAFDAAGYRLGRGGGHYDATFPPGHEGPLLVGVAFERQIVASVPHASHDRRMDAIVTERALRCPGRGAA